MLKFCCRAGVCTRFRTRGVGWADAHGVGIELTSVGCEAESDRVVVQYVILSQKNLSFCGGWSGLHSSRPALQDFRAGFCPDNSGSSPAQKIVNLARPGKFRIRSVKIQAGFGSCPRSPDRILERPAPTGQCRPCLLGRIPQDLGVFVKYQKTA